MEGLPKKDPGFDKVINLPKTPELEILGLSDYPEQLIRETQKQAILSDQILREFEREKSLEEIKVIVEIMNKVPHFIQEYGAESCKAFPVDSVHILNEDDAENSKIKNYLESGTEGKYEPYHERIEIMMKVGDYYNLAKILIHELIHANSFQSLEKLSIEENDSEKFVLSPRRLGLIVNQNGKYRQFRYLNEAVTEELTKRFCRKYLPEIDSLKDKYLEEYSTQIQLDARAKNPFLDVVLEEVDGAGSSYWNERVSAVGLIYALYEANKNDFADYEEVFKVFSKAMLTGNILTLAKLVDKTFGQGAFRRMGIFYLTPSPKVTPDELRQYFGLNGDDMAKAA